MSRLAISLSAVAAAIGLTLATGMVIARPASYDPQTVYVEYGDLDLTSAAGAATLYRRVAAAAEDVCGNADPRDTRTRRQLHECVSRAISDALSRVDDSWLTALHREDPFRARRA